MPFRYSCFISYRQLEVELAKQFIVSLRDALDNHIYPYIEKKVFLDEKRLNPPAKLDPSIAHHLCESMALVMVFSPRYFNVESPWCAREYQAMLDLEKTRLEALPKTAKAQDHGLIIPIVFRGLEVLPDEIRKRRLYMDFSGFSLASPDIKKSPEYIEKIERVARTLFEIHEEFEALAYDPCAQCEHFTLPDEDKVKQWVRTLARPRPVLPSRFEGRP